MGKARGQEPERRADETGEADGPEEAPTAEAVDSPQATTEGFSPNSTMEGRGGRPEDLSPDDFE